LLDILYTQLARARRRYYQRRPNLRRRLAAPVISVGNLTVGGSGKTPLAAEIARMLVAMGERPSILSRGYARKIRDEGVVVVSDGRRVLADVAHAGDEPLLLAHIVPRAAVLVSSSRYVAGRIAETKLACTVHVLDDGFQHFDLMRDVDLLVVPDTLDDTRTLPFGRFREPLDAATAADALLVETTAVETAPATQDSPVAQDSLVAQAPATRAVIEALSHQKTFEFSRRIVGPSPGQPAYAFAGIARPERFYEDLQKAGWRLTGRRSFGDHHHFSEREIEEIVRAATHSGAAVILTTEKDFVRIGSDPRTSTGVRPHIVPVPLEVAITPSFQPWLAERLHAARATSSGAPA